MAKEINGIGLVVQGNYPIINGVGIVNQPEYLVVNGVGVNFEPRKKYQVFVDGVFSLLQMDGKIATTDKGLAVNLNRENQFNLFYNKL